MWQPSEAAALWHHAMQRQDVHELSCVPCRINQTPQCPEGLRLQALARAAHEAHISDEYARLAVA